MFRYHFYCNIFSHINNCPPSISNLLWSNLYRVEKPFMRNWLTEKEASSFFSFFMKILKIPCLITLNSLNLETRQFSFNIFLIINSEFFELYGALCICFNWAIWIINQILRDRTPFFWNLDKIFFYVYIFFYITALSH